MTKKRSKISIGMPVYNGEKYIGEAIESILAQTYSNFEFIISDNASIDRTQEICQRYAVHDKRIQYYRNPANLGAAPNYNRAFELSSGEYFKWADYDDLIAPDFIMKCWEILEQNSDVVLCYPLSRLIDEHGQVLGDYSYKAYADASEPHIRFRDFTLHPDTGYQVSGLIRSSAIKKTSLHGSYPASDLVFLAELTFYGRFIELTEPLFFPRYHPDQSTKGEQTVERDRVVFFDTSMEDKITLPKWLLLKGFLNAIRNGPINQYQKTYCYLQMIRWIFIPDHFRALGKDILIALVKLIMRTFSVNRTQHVS
jgi:glycosyltransferase involved in cell wall biosynthesis